jgi:hypothetical protein
MEHWKGQQQDGRFYRQLLKQSYGLASRLRSARSTLAIDLNRICALDIE